MCVFILKKMGKNFTFDEQKEFVFLQPNQQNMMGGYHNYIAPIKHLHNVNFLIQSTKTCIICLQFIFLLLKMVSFHPLSNILNKIKYAVSIQLRLYTLWIQKLFSLNATTIFFFFCLFRNLLHKYVIRDL